tara:strand:+ start:220 stop:693 length:474 start_codon:yes stop_codon:yes gene_type:complete
MKHRAQTMKNKQKHKKQIREHNTSIKKHGLKDNFKKNLVETFIGMLNTVKLFHWKTYAYSTHESLDVLYKELNEHIDEFMETLLGKDESRIPNFKKNIELFNDSSENLFKEKIYNYRDYLMEMDRVLDKKYHSDLLNIRDEILGTINRFLYLMTLSI